MIIIDSSAIVAILLDGPEAFDFEGIIARRRCFVGAPTLCEARMALDKRLQERAEYAVLGLIQAKGIEVISFDEAMAAEGIAAFNRYGKGRGHPAQLNFGDCLSYAVAKCRNLPLLFQGGDFPHTDLVPAHAPAV
jgi:ribonuclease VapC